ncbi:MAG: SET domain-containing protein-lysine N-methyltransferase [Epsilonproteobacteria bacterium]|nr:MAG: SET domain-containing protein-lysine N-methyltransferase [Campylobacterota bacterium]RLA64303.1 MAG: SET domain-containing protein-lysine N-methyltransferase [Campylobacterota bacterium]
MKTMVQNSSIHGRGLFSSTEIKEGEHIGTFEGIPAKRNNKYILWLEEEKGLIPYRIINEMKYANHSTSPNAELDGLNMFATKRIFIGEEITFHYGSDWS